MQEKTHMSFLFSKTRTTHQKPRPCKLLCSSLFHPFHTILNFNPVKNIILIAISISILTSCQKVITLDLNSASPKYVIEGGINNGSEPCQVKITKTRNFSDNNNFEGIENAVVTISDNTGQVTTLPYTNGGVYQTSTLQGIPGRIYNLTVKLGNETFSATSQMPYPVKMDTLYSYDFIGFGDTIKMANVAYQDPAGVKNYYRFILTLNQDVKETVYISDDQFNDGKKATQYINYFNNDLTIESKDSVDIEMQCMDAGVYNFFFTLNQTISQSAAAPTNPISNISGGALGYFSAYTVQRKSIQIQ
jgi:hypothetical protein